MNARLLRSKAPAVVGVSSERGDEAGTAPKIDPLLACDNVRKSYDSQDALRGVSLDITSGDFVGIVGPSGCGKSTLLRLMSGLESPTSGEVRVEGIQPHLLPGSLRPSKLVFQDYALFPSMTVQENIAFGLRVRKLPRAEIRRMVDDALELVGLVGKGGSRPRELSGGQQQRVALARALVTQPRLLLLDEPFAALDARIVRVLEAELKSLQAQLGVTIVLVTHDQQQVLSTANRIIIMRDGVIEQTGSCEDVYRRPRTQFVADFLGEVNLLPGTVLGLSSRGCTVSVFGSEGPAVLADGVNLSLGEHIAVAVRPEDMVVDSPDNKRVNGLFVRCMDVEFCGSHVRLTLRHQESEKDIYAHVRAPAQFGQGDVVQLSWRPEAAVAVAS